MIFIHITNDLIMKMTPTWFVESTKEGGTANTKIVSKNDDTATDSSNEGSGQESTKEGGTATNKIVSKSDDTATDSSNEGSGQESTQEGGTSNTKIVPKNDDTAIDASSEDSGQGRILCKDAVNFFLFDFS